MSPPTDAVLEPLDLALSGSVAEIGARAETGEAEAQLALSIIFLNGLHGEPVQPQAGQVWRTRAAGQTRVMPITQYTAAFNGQPSRVNIINARVPVVDAGRLTALDQCVDALKGSMPLGPCGETGWQQSVRETAWRAARR